MYGTRKLQKMWATLKDQELKDKEGNSHALQAEDFMTWVVKSLQTQLELS